MRESRCCCKWETTELLLEAAEVEIVEARLVILERKVDPPPPRLPLELVRSYCFIMARANFFKRFLSVVLSSYTSNVGADRYRRSSNFRALQGNCRNQTSEGCVRLRARKSCALFKKETNTIHETRNRHTRVKTNKQTALTDLHFNNHSSS